MDGPTIIALAGLAVTGGTGLVAVTVYAATTRSTAAAAAHKAKNLEAALSGHIANADRVFARKETIAPQLDAMRDSLERIETRQTALIERLMGPGV